MFMLLAAEALAHFLSAIGAWFPPLLLLFTWFSSGFVGRRRDTWVWLVWPTILIECVLCTTIVNNVHATLRCNEPPITLIAHKWAYGLRVTGSGKIVTLWKVRIPEIAALAINSFILLRAADCTMTPWHVCWRVHYYCYYFHNCLPLRTHAHSANLEQQKCTEVGRHLIESMCALRQRRRHTQKSTCTFSI